MQNEVNDCLDVQYPVYIVRRKHFYFENMGFCDMMKMVYFLDMPFEHFC